MPVPDDALQQCQETIKYRFADVSLLSTALTHSSISNQRMDSNERLEFLGDAVLGIIICEELYRLFPQQLEGDLTIRKSAVVSRRTCAQVAQKLGLARFLSLGKGISEQQDLPESLSAAVLEAIHRAKPSAVKGRYLRRASVSGTMSPGVMIDTEAMLGQAP